MIAVVLFFAGGQLCGQLGKGVRNADNFPPDLKRLFRVRWAGHGDRELFQVSVVQSWDANLSAECLNIGLHKEQQVEQILHADFFVVFDRYRII